MADGTTTPAPNSADAALPPQGLLGWTPLPSFFGLPPLTERGAVGVDFFESWLDASRKIADTWRTTVRHQQDMVLASWRLALPHTPTTDTAGLRPDRTRP